MEKLFLFLADGFEEIEALGTIDVCAGEVQKLRPFLSITAEK